MRSQWRRDRSRLRQRKVWTLPLALLGCALVLSWLLPAIDRELHTAEQQYGEKLFPILDSGSMASLLGAIAGGMITLTGLVFTATTLAMQYGATQLSVRVVPMLQQDRVMRWATGTFMATFLYSLLIAIRLAVRQQDYRPVLSTFFALGLTLLSACLFFAVVTRIGLVLNSSALLRWIGSQGVRAVGRLDPATSPGKLPPEDPEPAEITLERAPRTGQVLLAWNEPKLRRIARDGGFSLELCVSPGDFVALRSTLFLVHGHAGRPLPARRILGCLLFAECYSPETDPAGALRTLVDVALKALSPAVNDPARAVQALDHIEDLLVMLIPLASAGSGPGAGTSGDALLRHPVRTWADYVCVGTDEIRHFAADSIQVQRRLRALFERLAWLCSSEQATALQQRLDTMDSHARSHWTQALDRRLARRPDAQGLGSEAGTDLT